MSLSLHFVTTVIPLSLLDVFSETPFECSRNRFFLLSLLSSPKSIKSHGKIKTVKRIYEKCNAFLFFGRFLFSVVTVVTVVTNRERIEYLFNSDNGMTVVTD